MSDELELSGEQLEVIREKFHFYDVEKNGHIPVGRLGDVMRNLGHNLRPDQLRELIDEVDKDKSGTIEWEEFLPLYAFKLKEKEEIAFYKELFRMLDKKNRGYISVADLQFILRGMAASVGLTEEEMDDMVQTIDEDGNGQVTFDEFYLLMTSA